MQTPRQGRARRKARANRRNRFFLYAFLGVILASAPFIFFSGRGKEPDRPDYYLPVHPSSSTGQPELADRDVTLGRIDPIDSSFLGEITIETETLPVAPDEPEETDPPVDTREKPEADDPDQRPFVTLYGVQTPERDEVSEDYFKDALFIGDSRMEGLINHTRLSNYCYAQPALSVKTVLTTEFVEDASGHSRTVLNALKRDPEKFSKIYIGFGVNEYGYADSVFASCFKYFLEQIQEIVPQGTQIYVMSLYPVNEGKAAANNMPVQNRQLIGHNDVLAELCSELDVCFLNVAEVINDNGRFDLPYGWSNDGVHLNFTPLDKIADYIRCHTMEVQEAAPETEPEPEASDASAESAEPEMEESDETVVE